MKPTRLHLAPLTLVGAVLLPACLMNSDTHVEQRGHAVGDETMQQLAPGQRKDFVLAVLGEPSSRKAFEGGMEIWKWSSTQVERTESGLIFVFASKRSVEQQQTVFVEFKDDVVTRAWRD